MTPDERAAVEGFLAVLGGVPEDAERTVYLCHLYCELGATPAIEAFRLIHDFLRENPNEVVVLLVEDFVDTEDAVAVLERSGLADHTLSWQRGEPLPTLGEMISRDDNVVVLAENDLARRRGTSPPTTCSRTRRTRSPSQRSSRATSVGVRWTTHCSCSTTGSPSTRRAAPWPPRPTGGTCCSSGPSGARPSAAELPNILAVDFYADGDLFAVVDELNGVGPP